MTFFPMHILGLAGMPRRISDYPDVYSFWNYVSSVGALLSLIGILLFLVVVFELLYSAFIQYFIFSVHYVTNLYGIVVFFVVYEA